MSKSGGVLIVIGAIIFALGVSAILIRGVYLGIPMAFIVGTVIAAPGAAMLWYGNKLRHKQHSSFLK